MFSLRRSLTFLSVFAALACAGDPTAVVSDESRAMRVAGDGQAPHGPTPAAQGLEVRYLGNEGFLIESGEHRVLIDALFGDGIAGYDVVPNELREALEQGVGEWGDIDVAVASHYHADHFDAAAVRRFLEANPQALFVSTPQAAASFDQIAGGRGDLTERFRGVLPAIGEVAEITVDGLHIEVLNLHHGARNPPVENIGVVVTLDEQRFLHFGDTEATREDFEPYASRLAEVDIALLPFWFLSSDWRADFVAQELKPRRVVVAHLPTPEAPSGYFARWRSYEELRALIESRFPDAWIPAENGQRLP